jgi:tetratricopeptide (TPR) repeat protein
MKAARIATAAVLVIAALVPELRRYGAERRLRTLTTAFRVAATAREATQRARLLEAVAAGTAGLDRALPADARPLVLAGSAHLVARQPDAALAAYRRALDAGERAETDLNIARALALLGRTEAAEAALLRALWVNPTLVGALPQHERVLWRRRLHELRRELRAGRLPAPPPAPEWPEAG